MSSTAAAGDPVQAFIDYWKDTEGAERANFAKFAIELCRLLDVDAPEAQRDPERDRYVFEYPVTFDHPDGTSSTGRIDLYHRDRFVMEAKQGSDATLAQLPLFGEGGRRHRRGTAVRGTDGWTLAMQRAKGQAERYAKALPIAHGWPPFLIVVDVGHVFELYADFSRTGKAYTQFPDAQGFRIPIERLADEETRTLLRTIWTEPMSLDPAARAERVTKEVSTRLAFIARALEKAGHVPERVAGFLMRCMFSMFAEDVGLLPGESFSALLESLRGKPRQQQMAALERFWADMDTGAEWSPFTGGEMPRFNGGLFAERAALPLEPHHLGELIAAAKADWRDVEPAIFGTFLEQALDPRERQRLGAEFTPRRWVERLVMPAVIEPLREEWDNVKATALGYDLAGDRNKAVATVAQFRDHLCGLEILDPACGSGNFLYVTMEHLKRLEGEVVDLLANDLGAGQAALDLASFTVDPHQFLGIEKNERAAWVADVVLWIGYLQWHFKTRGQVLPAQPVLKNFHNIACRDALLDWDRVELVRDAHGRPVTRWDGHTTTTDPATGRAVPDETARVELERYVAPRPAPWPEADFIVGNPPFTGGKDLRDRLGGYAEALWTAYPDMPRSADLVMYWWRRAADLVRTGKARRFGLITTNSLPQTFNRRVVAAALDAKPPLSLAFAIPDHPWYVGEGMASVRIAMTVGVAGDSHGKLLEVKDKKARPSAGSDFLKIPKKGKIFADLRVGFDVYEAAELRANRGVANRGMYLFGQGFLVEQRKASELGLGEIKGIEKHIRPYRNGRDILARPRGLFAIDAFPLDEETLRQKYPKAFQHLLSHVKPERDSNNRKSRRDRWWIFGEPLSTFRPLLENISRYVVTVRVAKHRIFTFLDRGTIPESRLVVFALEDAFFLGVLSSRVQELWALRVGGWQGVGNDHVYNVTECFDPFPFPTATEAQKAAIRDLAEELDALRKRVLAEHADLTLTGLYNVREKLAKGEALTARDRDTYERGCVGTIAHLHDELDRAVADAYGWPADLADADILARLVALNRERRAEERRGHVRWLRPDYQAPRFAPAAATQEEITVAPAATTTASAKPAWPKALPERITAVRDALAKQEGPRRPEELAAQFKRRPTADVAEILETLTALGLARHIGDGRFAM